MIELRLCDLSCEECHLLMVLYKVSFIPTEHSAAWTQNKVGEFIPEMALWCGRKRATSSLLFVQKMLIRSTKRGVLNTSFTLASHRMDHEIFPLKIQWCRWYSALVPRCLRHCLHTAATKCSLNASFPLASRQWRTIWSRPQTRFRDE